MSASLSLASTAIVTGVFSSVAAPSAAATGASLTPAHRHGHDRAVAEAAVRGAVGERLGGGRAGAERGEAPARVVRDRTAAGRDGDGAGRRARIDGRDAQAVAVRIACRWPAPGWWRRPSRRSRQRRAAACGRRFARCDEHAPLLVLAGAAPAARVPRAAVGDVVGRAEQARAAVGAEGRRRGARDREREARAVRRAAARRAPGDAVDEAAALGAGDHARAVEADGALAGPAVAGAGGIAQLAVARALARDAHLLGVAARRGLRDVGDDGRPRRRPSPGPARSAAWPSSHPTRFSLRLFPETVVRGANDGRQPRTPADAPQPAHSSRGARKNREAATVIGARARAGARTSASAASFACADASASGRREPPAAARISATRAASAASAGRRAAERRDREAGVAADLERIGAVRRGEREAEQDRAVLRLGGARVADQLGALAERARRPAPSSTAPRRRGAGVPARPAVAEQAGAVGRRRAARRRRAATPGRAGGARRRAASRPCAGRPWARAVRPARRRLDAGLELVEQRRRAARSPRRSARSAAARRGPWRRRGAGRRARSRRR